MELIDDIKNKNYESSFTSYPHIKKHKLTQVQIKKIDELIAKINTHLKK